MGKVSIPLVLVCALFWACSSSVSNEGPQNPAFAEEGSSGRERFFSDSLNVGGFYRTYPVPDVAYTPAPKGYKPVYISSYARHGSRRLIGKYQGKRVLTVLEQADELNCLTSLGEEVLAKVRIMADDQMLGDADLTMVGAEQHRGIAERMYRNYKNVFSRPNTPVRLYSTVTQRTMMSMFSQNARLLELNPHIISTRYASDGLDYLDRVMGDEKVEGPNVSSTGFLREHFDARPLLSRLFTEGMPALKDTAVFVHYLNSFATIARGLDLEGVDFIWDVFTYNELYDIQQGLNYVWYVLTSDSPALGDRNLKSVVPLLRDFIDRADAALAEDIPGADLRFGHDGPLTSLSALIAMNGYVQKEEDPLKVMDVFHIFEAAPMAGNIQMVFYRNRAGDVIVKLLQNEVEVFVPLDTDIYPYYHWDELKAYFESRIEQYQ